MSAGKGKGPMKGYNYKNWYRNFPDKLGPRKKCPKCKVELHWVDAYEPWSDEYLICPICDGTYNTWD